MRLRSPGQSGRIGIADGDEHVAQKTVAADALDGRAGKLGAEGGFVEDGEVRERRRGKIVAGLQFHLAGRLRELVPRADGEAIVAAIDAVAHGGAEFARDRAGMLDGEIGDAAAGIEAVGRREGLGRADIEAGLAGAAMVGLGRVRRQGRLGQDGAEEEPRAELPADQIGVLALPADTGGGGQRFLHQRGGIDENLHIRLRIGGEAPGDTLELALDEVVIVAMAGIDGDGGALRLRQRCQRVRVRPVIQAEHDDGLRLGPERARAHPALRLGLEPVHAAVQPFGDERSQPWRGLGNRVRRRDADQLEALGAGVLDQPALERSGVRRAGLLQCVGWARRHGAE